MSTRIYNGLMLNIDVEKTFKNIQPFRKKINKLLYDEYYYQLIRLSEVSLHQYNVKNTELMKYLETKSDARPIDYARYLMQNIDQLKNYSITLQIFFVRNNILGLCFNQSVCDYDKKIYPLIKKYFKVKEFGYWDNTDKPDNLSSKEWNIRKNLWNKALEINYIPGQNGVSVICELPEWKKFDIDSLRSTDYFKKFSDLT